MEKEHNRIIKVSPHLRSFMFTNDKLKMCWACRKNFRLTIKEIARKGQGSKNTRYYHVKCAKEKNVI